MATRKKKTDESTTLALPGITDLAVSPPPAVAVLATEVDLVTKAIAVYGERRVTNQEELEVFNARFAASKARVKELDSELKAFSEPIKAALNRVAGWFKPSKAAHEDFQAVLKRGMAAYLLEQDRIQTKALEAAKADFEAGKEEAGAAIIQAVESQPELNVGTSAKTVWKFEIIDPNAVPRGYCSPDETKIRLAVKAGQRTIEGVRIYEDKQFTQRTAQ